MTQFGTSWLIKLGGVDFFSFKKQIHISLKASRRKNYKNVVFPSVSSGPVSE